MRSMRRNICLEAVTEFHSAHLGKSIFNNLPLSSRQNIFGLARGFVSSLDDRLISTIGLYSVTDVELVATKLAVISFKRVIILLLELHLTVQTSDSDRSHLEQLSSCSTGGL